MTQIGKPLRRIIAEPMPEEAPEKETIPMQVPQPGEPVPGPREPVPA
jgi:hypothetical protein